MRIDDRKLDTIVLLQPWIDALNDHFNAPVVTYSISYVDEYLTLYRNGRKITDGEPEVVERIKWIAREEWIDLPELDQTNDECNDFY